MRAKEQAAAMGSLGENSAELGDAVASESAKMLLEMLNDASVDAESAKRSDLEEIKLEAK